MLGEFIGAAKPVTIHTPVQLNHTDQFYFVDDAWIATPMLIDLYCNEEDACPSLCSSYMSPWWPGGGSALVSDGGLYDYGEIEWGDSYPVSGANGRFGVTGYTRNAAGQAVANVRVMLYFVNADTTQPDTLVHLVYSDANGYYLVSSPYAGAHYIVAIGTGMAGATPALITLA